MGIGSSGVVNCANTYLGTANYTVADGYVADRTVIVDGNGPAQLNLNFARDEVLDPRITFSRTSNATRVNAQGLIEYAPHNLLTYSEQFDNAVWGVSGGVVAPNSTISPSGEITADTLTENVGSTDPRFAVTYSFAVGVNYALSVYAKVKPGSSPRYLMLVFNSGYATPCGVNFDLSVGAVGTSRGATGYITQLADGWYRCSMVPTSNAIGGGSLRIRMAAVNTAGNITGPTPYTGDGVSGLYLWGAQLNIGSLQPYYTTSVKNLLGYSQNFENAAWTKSNSSVLTNLLTYSQEFGNASWNNIRASVTENATISPDGTADADKLVEDTTASSTHVAAQDVSVILGTVYSFSFYLKAAERVSVLASLSVSFAANSDVIFDASTGIVTVPPTTALSASMTPVGNGWYRCVITATANATGTGNFAFYLRSGNNIIYTGNGTSGIYIWGAQLVQGTNPEEYTVTTSAPAPIQVMGPLGFLGAEKLVENTVNTTHSVAQNLTYSTQPYTISVYAKAGERSWIMLNIWDGTTTWNRYFNLLTGTVGTGTASNYNITNIGAGWYRCSITTTTAIGAGQNSSLYIAQSNGVIAYTGDGTSGIYIFGAQLSDSASLDPYVYNFGAAPTSSAYYGPRFDYDPVTLAPKGLLIEEQRVNSIRNNTMQGAVVGTPGTLPTNYTYTGGGLVANVVGIGYEGGINYVDIQFVGTATSGSSGLRFEGNAGVGASTGQTWNTSFYVRKISGTTSGISGVWTGLTYLIAGASSDAITKAIPFDTLDLTSIAYNRQDVTLTAVTSGITTVRPQLVLGHNIGANIDITLRIGMPQLEQGAFPTSVIPTTTTQVTRTADNASMVGTNFSSWYNQSEGTIYSEWDVFGFPARPCSLILDNGNRLTLASTATFAGLDGNVSSVYQGTGLSGSYAINTNYKHVGAYQLNNTAVAINGAASATDTTYLIPTVNQMLIGASLLASATSHNGHIQSIKYFNKRFLNTYLQSLTQ